MELITELLEKVRIDNKFEKGALSWVDVTHINDPHSFYVRPTSYRMYMPAIPARGKKASASDLQIQMNIVYKSKTLKCYCRGNILFLNKSDENVTCDIFSIDFGCIEKSISLRRIYLPEHEHNIPPLATHCQLADCQPKDGVWTEKEVDAMKFFIGEERAKMIVRGKTHEDKLIVQLINTCPDDIATILALTGYTTLGYHENVISRIPISHSQRHYFTFKKLKPGDTLHVRTQSGNNLLGFYVAEIDDYKQYIKDRTQLMSFSKTKRSIRPEDMKENGPVSVFVPTLSRYERAIIKTIKVSEEKASVQLVDWGTILDANVSQMKNMSEIHFEQPTIAVYCSVENSQLQGINLEKILWPGYQFKITIKATGDQMNSPHIIEIITI